MFSRFMQILRLNRNYQRTIRLLINSTLVNTNLKSLLTNKYVITGPLIAGALWGNQSEQSLTKKKVLLARADALFDQGKYREIYELLSSYKDSDETEILWRLARALYKISETASEPDTKKLIAEGFEIISKALKTGDDNFAVHKWMAVLLDKRSEHVGMKERIKQLENVKKHLIRASEINPKDATTLYMIGQWCYSVAELSWYERKLASTFFATPPESSYEEALKYFKQAESIDPMFYSFNLLMLGKTYYKMKNSETAKKWFRMASEYPAKTDEDHIAKQEAHHYLHNKIWG